MAIRERELELFYKEMADVSPLKAEAKVILKEEENETPGQQYRREQAAFNKNEEKDPLSMVLRKKLGRDEWLSYKRDGIQSGVFKKLRNGLYPQEAVLNINRKHPAVARDELITFIRDSQENNIRSTLIFFGSGGQGDVLKSYLAQWLPALEVVQAFHTAQKHHSGRAAVYVLFRKSEQKRQENRERHAARLGEAL